MCLLTLPISFRETWRNKWTKMKKRQPDAILLFRRQGGSHHPIWWMPLMAGSECVEINGSCNVQSQSKRVHLATLRPLQWNTSLFMSTFQFIKPVDDEKSCDKTAWSPWSFGVPRIVYLKGQANERISCSELSIVQVMKHEYSWAKWNNFLIKNDSSLGDVISCPMMSSVE